MITVADIERAVAELQGEVVEADVELCDAALALQLCHMLGFLPRTHVAVESITRLCLQVLGRPSSTLTTEAFPALASLCQTNQGPCEHRRKGNDVHDSGRDIYVL